MDLWIYGFMDLWIYGLMAFCKASIEIDIVFSFTLL